MVHLCDEKEAFMQQQHERPTYSALCCDVDSDDVVTDRSAPSIKLCALVDGYKTRVHSQAQAVSSYWQSTDV